MDFLSSKVMKFEVRKYDPQIVIGTTSSRDGTTEGHPNDESDILSAHEALSSLFSGYKSNVQHYNILQPDNVMRLKPMNTTKNINMKKPLQTKRQPRSRQMNDMFFVTPDSYINS